MLAAEFGERLVQLIVQLKSTPLASGTAEIFYPGEIEARNAERYSHEGLVLPVQTNADLDSLANELHIDKAYH